MRDQLTYVTISLQPQSDEYVTVRVTERNFWSDAEVASEVYASQTPEEAANILDGVVTDYRKRMRPIWDAERVN